MRCELKNGRLACGGVVVMDEVSAEVSLVEGGAGVILRVRIPRQAYAMAPLGKPRVQRFTACYRHEPFWMRPHMGRRVAEVPAETQFFLAELANGQIAIMVPLISESMRCALQGNEDDRLMLTADAGHAQA